MMTSAHRVRAWLSELRRRGVFHVTGLYAVGAWALVQLVDAISGPFPLPETALRLIWFAALLGFPVALVFGWRYDITKSGIVRTHRRLSHGEDVPIGRADYGFIGALAFVMVGIAGMTAVGVLDAIGEAKLRAAAGPETFEPPANSIAVLAFENMSSDPEQEYFSDGISEEILNVLAQIKGLKVIARHSSFSFKGKDDDIATMARQLNVRHILEGSVRTSGDQVRITAQLIDAKDSSHRWSQTYDRDYDAENLFRIQSEIARAIADRLRLTFTSEDEARLARVPTKNTEAYAAYLFGRERLKKRKVAELADAVGQFSLAIELDPKFAAAYAGLADACHIYEAWSGGLRSEHCPSSLAEREQLARKALELDAESAEAWLSLGTSLWERAVDMHETEQHPAIYDKFQESIAAYERGLQLNPTLSEGYLSYGHNLMWIHAYPDPPFGWSKAWKAGRWQSVFDKGLEVDPLSISLHRAKSWYPITVSSKEEAKYHAHRMVEIAPDSPLGYSQVGKQEWELDGRIDQSILWLTKSMQIDPQNPETPGLIGLAYSALGDSDIALAYFHLAKVIIAPANKPAHERLLAEQAVVRLVSGEYDVNQVGDLLPPLSEPTSYIGMALGIFVDLTTGRPADALSRMEAYSPECIGVEAIPAEQGNCPVELVRAYQELSDHQAARALSEVVLRRTEIAIHDFPVTWTHFRYARDLATAGRAAAALDVLEGLVTSGWRGDSYNKHLRFYLCCDVGFDAIRDHERFRAIAATIEADMAQQLENVREMQHRGEVPTLEEVRALVATRQEAD